MSRKALLHLAWAAAGAASVAACKGYRTQGFEQPMKLGGKVIPAPVLTSGEIGYVLYCRACHGDKGDGKGPAAPGLRPPPRDFTLGSFKFAAVPGGTLPNDDDLVRVVRTGLHGTAMRAWDGIPEETVREIVQYLKTFSPRWKEEEPGAPIVPTPDPWKGREKEGVERGRAVYHGLAQCLSCHPAYAPKQYIHDVSKVVTGTGTRDFREDMYGAELKNSDYGVKLLPPDFTRAELRSVRPEHRLEDLYRVVASGVGGTAMPTWRDALPEGDIWALVHFVNSLVAMKGTDGPRRLRAEIAAADAEWRPPPR
ncbi:MAG TPA: c-type cytochrome [Anaeromyxobacteraceae bacterium]|nr:c-type cytochrome [Anaeromyxobacteraceae bacterium]